MPSSFGKSNASATLTIKARNSTERAAIGSRKRDYISGATEGILIAFVDSEATPLTTYQGFTLSRGATATAASPASCNGAGQDGPYTCTLYFSLSPADAPYTATLTAYDAPQSGTGATPAAATGATSAVALSTDTETLTVNANQANNFSFTLHGIVQAFEAAPQYIGVPASPAPSSPLSTTFHALDGDDYLIDAVDASASFYAGSQPNGPFAAATFPVTASDENTCSPAPCVALASPPPVAIADPTTEGIAFVYNGGGTSGDGSTANPPYYGLIGAAEATGYSGNVSATIGGTPYAATAYVVPFFGFVDTSATPANAAAVDATHVSFTASGNSVTLDAVQFHLPTGSTAYSATPDSSCTNSSGTVASVTASNALTYGESFTLSAGNASGTCTIVLSDGVAADAVTIDVTSTAAGGSTVTVPCGSPVSGPDARSRGVRPSKRVAAAQVCATTATFVQATSGVVSTGDDEAGITVKNPGDVLYCTVAFTQDGGFDADLPGEYNVFYDSNGQSNPGLFTIYEDALNVGSHVLFSSAVGPTSFVCYEFANTDSDAITDANPNYATQLGGTTQTISPAATSAVLSFVASNSASAYDISNGWQSAGAVAQGVGSIGAQELRPPYPPSVSNTFTGGDGNPVSSSIVEIPGTGYSADARTRHTAHHRKTKLNVKHDMIAPR